jgi:hypothetical protein
MKPKQYVFIDDSGDPGLRNSNTEKLIVAAVIVVDEERKTLLKKAVDLFRANLGWNEKHEFKFSATEKEIITNLLNFIRNFEFSAYAVVVDKSKIKTANLPKDEAPLYYIVLKELLAKVAQNGQKIIIDGKTSKKYSQKVRAYLRQSLRAKNITGCDIKFVDSRNDSLVQVADIVAGAVARSYQMGKPDAKKYAKLLKDKIVKIDELTF